MNEKICLIFNISYYIIRYTSTTNTWNSNKLISKTKFPNLLVENIYVNVQPIEVFYHIYEVKHWLTVYKKVLSQKFNLIIDK